MNPMTADQLRREFLAFFASRGHTVVPGASLIPHDPDLLFTVAGMVPFKPYFLGEEVSPNPRVTTVQPCVRVGGKHNDLEEVGRDASHLSFFEMLGNFSFGDYFKAEAIPMAWDMVTDLFGIDPDQLWITVHTDDDEAEQLWIESAGVDPGRIQRLGDNCWGRPAAHRAVRARLRDLLRPGPGLWPGRGPGPRRPRPASSRSGTSCSCSSTATATASTPSCPARTSTPARASSASWACSRARTRSGRPTRWSRWSKRPQSVTGRRLRRVRGGRRRRCASWPSTPAP